jgi:hypothetical protein
MLAIIVSVYMLLGEKQHNGYLGVLLLIGNGRSDLRIITENCSKRDGLQWEAQF